MSESADEENHLTREEIDDSGIDVAITDIFKKPTTKLVLETSNGEIERATLLGESQEEIKDISVKGNFKVKEIGSDEALFLELEFLDEGEKYYIELDEDTIWNIYQHFGTIKQDDLMNQRSVLDHVNNDSIVLNRSQYKEIFNEKPSLPNQDDLDVSLTLKDYEKPVGNYEEIVHEAALNKNTPFSVIVEDIEEEDKACTVLVRHGELLYTFEYLCNSELQNCNPMFKRLVNDVGKGEPKAVEGSTLQIREKNNLSKEQPVYGELDGGEYVLTRPLTNSRDVFNTVSSLLSKGKIMYRGNSDEDQSK